MRYAKLIQYPRNDKINHAINIFRVMIKTRTGRQNHGAGARQAHRDGPDQSETQRLQCGQDAGGELPLGLCWCGNRRLGGRDV